MPDVKLIRKQILNVIKEQGADIVAKEAYKQAFDQLRKELTERLEAISKQVAESLAKMEGRQKDVQSMLTRAVFTNPETPPKELDKSPDKT